MEEVKETSKESRVLAIKKSLRSQHPEWSEDKVVSTAFKVYNSKKEFSNLKVEFKSDSGEFYTQGLIATSHLDSDNDIILMETLKVWEKQINDKSIAMKNNVSLHHDRSDSNLIATGVKAEVRELPDGEYGLWVENHHNKTHPRFDTTKYEVENGFLHSYSIEYDTKGDKTVETFSVDGENFRVLGPETSLWGWTLANNPANPQAAITGVLVKELKISIKEESDDSMMTEEQKKKKKQMMMDEEKKDSKESEVKVMENKIESPQVKEAISEEFAITSEEKEEVSQARESKETSKMVQRLLKSKELAQAMKSLEVTDKTLKNKEVAGGLSLEVKEYLTGVQAGTTPSYQLFSQAGIVAEKLGLIGPQGFKENGMAEMRKFSMKIGGKLQNELQYKGLGVTTNQNTDTDYLLSSAELQDVFDPVIYNALKEQTTTWGLLAKEDFSNKGNNQVQFVMKITANSTAAAYTGNAIDLSNSERQKYQTKFKKYAVGIAVDGDMIAASRGGPVGDVFSMDVKNSTETLLSVMNIALFAEVGLETAAGVIGFEYLADGAGNATLYNVTRSAANGLLPDTAADTYVNGASADLSIANLRALKRNAVENGAKLGNLFYVGSPIQGDKLLNIYDDAQRLAPVSSRLGFEGMPTFDGVPFFVDKDCNDDDVYLIDRESHKVAVWIPPTLEMFGKRSDAVEGFVKTYWCTYNTAPRRIGMIYSNSTS